MIAPTDIVERLSEAIDLHYSQSRPWATAVDREAKAEIERLRAALEGVIRVADRKTVEFDAARAALSPQVDKALHGQLGTHAPVDWRKHKAEIDEWLQDWWKSPGAQALRRLWRDDEKSILTWKDSEMLNRMANELERLRAKIKQLEAGDGKDRNQTTQQPD